MKVPKRSVLGTGLWPDRYASADATWTSIVVANILAEMTYVHPGAAGAPQHIDFAYPARR